MKSLNTLEAISRLALEGAAEAKRKDDEHKLTKLTNISLIKNFDELELYCDRLVEDCNKAESLLTNSDALTQRLMSTSAAVESLTDDLCNSQELVGKLQNDSLSMAALQRQIAEKNIEIKSLSVYKRKSEVLAKDLKAAEAKLLKAKSTPVHAVTEKPTARYKKLERLYDNQVSYTQELLEWGEVSPRYTETLHHSKQGLIDVIDLKIEESDVSELGSDIKTIERCQRFIVLNKFNDMKMVTRVIGQDGMHRTKTPKGMTVKIDNEVLLHIDAHIEKAATISGHIKTQGEQIKKAGKK